MFNLLKSAMAGEVFTVKEDWIFFCMFGLASSSLYYMISCITCLTFMPFQFLLEVPVAFMARRSCERDLSP